MEETKVLIDLIENRKWNELIDFCSTTDAEVVRQALRELAINRVQHDYYEAMEEAEKCVVR